MKNIFPRLITLTALIVSLSACFGPSTPQEVSQVFWEAVVNDNAKAAVRYSTLTEVKYYDRFAKDWAGFEPSFGKVIIEKKEASVVTEFASPANAGLENRRFTTYLILRDGKWIVDYDRTKNAIHGGALGELFSKFNQMGQELSRQLEDSTRRFKLEMERMGKELEQMSESFGQQASESVEKYSEQLRHQIKELEESINRALEEEDRHLSDEDKRALQGIANELKQDNQNLTEPSLDAVREGSQHVGETQQHLDSIDNKALDNYKKEWQALSQQFEATMRKLMSELSSQAEEHKK